MQERGEKKKNSSKYQTYSSINRKKVFRFHFMKLRCINIQIIGLYNFFFQDVNYLLVF